MAKTILTDIDLQQNEVQNAVLENRATAPTSPKPGQQYFDTTDNTVKTYNGTEWTSGGSGGGGTTITVDTALSTTSTNPVQNKVVTNAINGKQATLVSGTNIKTINGNSLLGSGNITISGGGGGGDSYITLEGDVLNVGNSDLNDASYNVTVIGANNGSKGDNNVIIGAWITTEYGGNIAIGYMDGPIISKNSIYMGVACPTNMMTELDGVIVFHISDQYESNTTQFYFMGEGTKLANAYCNGEAGFGYVSSSSSGTCKLSSICTENVGSFDPVNFEE